MHAGWPNRPWDKQNVDYGTLLQSHANYEALGVFDDSAMGNVDASKLYWIGDSWTVGLIDLNLVDSSKALAKIGASAYSLPEEPNPPEGTSGIIVALGKNDIGASGSNSIKTLVDNLKSKYASIPVFVLRLSYYGTADKSSGVDSFNETMKEYCSSKNGVTFVDPTSGINDVAAKTIKSVYNEPADNLHLTSEGYKVWYDGIIAAVGGNTSGSTTGGGTSGSTSGGSTGGSTGGAAEGTTGGGSSGAFGVEDTSEQSANRAVTANGITYLQFNQSGSYGSVNVYQGDTRIRTDSGDTTLSGMGCGIYSVTSMLSAYVKDVNPKKTCQWMHSNIGNSAFNNDGSRGTSMKKILAENGINAEWTDGSEAKLKEAFSAGKPVIINIKPGSRIWTTKGGHFICFCGVSSDGKVYTADSVAGGGDRICHDYGGSFDNAISKLWSDISAGSGVRFLIPDKAPDGVLATQGSMGENGEFLTAQPFQGYEADQKVASPVTGKILEIGKYDRVSIYSGETREVEYIKIKVIDSPKYFLNRIGANKTDYGYETETSYGVAEALDLFYKEYEDVCDGYVITIDGFDVDLSTGYDPEKDDEIEGNQGVYKKMSDEELKHYALFNSAQYTLKQDKEQAKEDAPFFVTIGVSGMPGDNYICDDPDSVEGYYIKEGKYIGVTTTSDTTLVENPEEPSTPSGEESEEASDLPDKLTYKYEDYAEIEGLTDDYMRIQIIDDPDKAIVEDVERFWDIPEFDSRAGLGLSVDQEYQAEEGDLELLADAIMHEHSRGDDHEDILYQSKSMGYTILNKLSSDGKYWVDYYNADETTTKGGIKVLWAPNKSKLYNLLCRSDAYQFYAIATTANCGDTLNLRERADQGKYHYTDDTMEAAEWCLTYDSTSLTNTGKHESGYSVGTPMAHTVWEQGAAWNGGRIWIHDGDYLFDTFDK